MVYVPLDIWEQYAALFLGKFPDRDDTFHWFQTWFVSATKATGVVARDVLDQWKKTTKKLLSKSEAGALAPMLNTSDRKRLLTCHTSKVTRPPAQCTIMQVELSGDMVEPLQAHRLDTITLPSVVSSDDRNALVWHLIRHLIMLQKVDQPNEDFVKVVSESDSSYIAQVFWGLMNASRPEDQLNGHLENLLKEVFKHCGREH